MDKGEVVFIDANIFLEVLLDDKRAEECDNFLQKVKNKEIFAITTDFLIYTCLLQLERKIKSPKILTNFIILLGELKGLKIIRPSLSEMYYAVESLTEYKLDFDDNLVVACMISNKIKTIVSLDKHFNKVNLIKRIEP